MLNGTMSFLYVRSFKYENQLIGSILENQDIVLRELDLPRRKLAELPNKT